MLEVVVDRIPEPELMDDDAQARAYAEADFEAPHSRFIELLQESLPELAERGNALDLGCGPADISLRFARAFPAWSVDGVDGSSAMLHYGRVAVERAGLQERVLLSQAYLPEDAPPRTAYDVVLSNSLLHHMARPAVFWDCVRRWAGAGASVFVMDLARPESRRQARRLMEQYASSEPEVLQRDFHDSLLAAYRVDEVESQLNAAGLEQLRVKPVGDRHWIAWGRR